MSKLIAIAILFVAANPMLAETAKPIKLKRIPVPERDYGYKDFRCTVLSSEVELAAFLNKAAKQKYWNNKDAFLGALKSLKIDFRASTLLLLRSAASSGSEKVSLAEPSIVGDELVCRIEWKHPWGGTENMVYRCYALVVPKGIAKQVRIVSPFKWDAAVIKLQ